MIGFTYDANGNVTSVTPPSRPAHAFTFTPSDLTATYTPPPVPNGGATQYAYNRDRQVMSVLRPDGKTVSMGYDFGGRLSSVGISRGAYSYGYNAAGQITSASSPDASTTYGYSGPLLTSMTSPAGAVVFSYDNDFRISSETAVGNAVAFGYDADGLLTAAGALMLQRDP